MKNNTSTSTITKETVSNKVYLVLKRKQLTKTKLLEQIQIKPARDWNLGWRKIRLPCWKNLKTLTI
jgi:hypothetical protein